MALIDRFKAHMMHGGARANQFKVTINVPPAILPVVTVTGTSEAAQTGWSAENAAFLCRATHLPGQTLTEIPIAFRGRQIFMAGDRSFDDPWTTTFFNDADFGIRTMIERWMNSINEMANGTGLVNPSSYQTDMYVQQLDRDNNVLKNYKFINAWPTTLGQIDLSAEQSTEIETFDVTWRYMHFLTNDVETKDTGVNSIGSVSEAAPAVASPDLGVFRSGIKGTGSKSNRGIGTFSPTENTNRGLTRAQVGGTSARSADGAPTRTA
jgi:hypothetical protein